MEELQIVSNDVALEKSQLEHQIDIARKYPRNWDKMVAEVEKRATRTKEVAEECFYSLPRGGKKIDGPGIRFAELILASYDNIRIGTRVVELTEKTIVGEAIIYDLQSNKQFNVREEKSIWSTKDNKRYSQDMIVVTGKAAIAIAKRNCIFASVPFVEFESVLKKVKLISTGAANPTSEPTKPIKPIEERRTAALAYFKTLGVGEDRVLWTLKLTVVDDIGEDALVELAGIRTSIKEQTIKIVDAFPPTPKEENKEKADNITNELKKDK